MNKRTTKSMEKNNERSQMTGVRIKNDQGCRLQDSGYKV